MDDLVLMINGVESPPWMKGIKQKCGVQVSWLEDSGKVESSVWLYYNKIPIR